MISQQELTPSKSVSLITVLAILYFFFNSLGLPEGPLYTTFLTPFFYWYLVKAGAKNVIGFFLLALLPIAIIHWFVGVNLYYYVKSSILYGTVYLFVYAFYVFVKRNNIETVIGQIALLNFAITILALGLYFTPLKEWVWHVKKITIEILDVSRLKLFTYEPSYYSTLLVPIVMYYSIGFFMKKYSLRSTLFISIMIFLPLVLSFSLGVISAFLFAVGTTVLFFFKKLFKRRRIFYPLVFASCLFILLGLVLFVFFPDNLLFLRIEDLFEGKDHSAKGRTIEAWKLSWQMAQYTSSIFGCGIGQIKIVGEEIIRVFYHYQFDDIPIIRVPSAIGETLATFGIFGLALRIGVEIWLFFKTKVYLNVLQFALFSYIFLYQFTGSYLTNVAEYVIWVLAFYTGFKDFHVSSIKSYSKV
ncbi:MAG: O-antigen ligase family protein [Flavobacteriales bacterium]|nr:O-antigen ligase family protein [Flavobacteriales bacterium]